MELCPVVLINNNKGKAQIHTPLTSAPGWPPSGGVPRQSISLMGPRDFVSALVCLGGGGLTVSLGSHRCVDQELHDDLLEYAFLVS